MRLDHLLSKEHFTGKLSLSVQSRARTPTCPSISRGVRVAWVVLEGGTLTSSAGSCGCS